MKKLTIIMISAATMSVAVATLAGCGTVQERNSSSATQPQPAQNVEKSLPASFQAKLSSPQSRLKSVSKLPADTVDIGQKVKNVLYIDPSEQYAIVQFRSVWDKLPSKPAIIWTGVTESQAQSIWAKEGYHGDPLSAENTLYIAQSLPTPDSYHRMGKSWREEPGITPNKDISFWSKFFVN